VEQRKADEKERESILKKLYYLNEALGDVQREITNMES